MSLDVAERIIVALDCDGALARSLARQLCGEALWLKVGMTLYYAEGPRIVRELKELGFKVFVDLKLHDIPHQVRGAAQTITEAGADMITVHSSGGAEMLRAAVDGAGYGFQKLSKREKNALRPVLLGITVLTSIDQQTLHSIGIDQDTATQVQRLAQLAMNAGLDGVVASPLEAGSLRSSLGQSAIIVTPGIRPAIQVESVESKKTDDQSRISTPRAALSAGASFLVIGRPITSAEDPLSAFRDIVRSID